TLRNGLLLGRANKSHHRSISAEREWGSRVAAKKLTPTEHLLWVLSRGHEARICLPLIVLQDVPGGFHFAPDTWVADTRGDAQREANNATHDRPDPREDR